MYLFLLPRAVCCGVQARSAAKLYIRGSPDIELPGVGNSSHPADPLVSIVSLSLIKGALLQSVTWLQASLQIAGFTSCPKAVSSFITVRPEAPEPMIAIFFFGTGALFKQSEQLPGIAMAANEGDRWWEICIRWVGMWGWMGGVVAW